MPDAALSVTQSAAEEFARSYLTALGAEIHSRNDGGSWVVELPTDYPFSADGQRLTIGLGNTLSEAEDDVDVRLTPESEFLGELLDAAAVAEPLGQATVSRDTVPVKPPDWLVPANGEYDLQFYPLYDRTATVVFFRASVETVSEYQTELLRATAVDEQTGNIRPAIAEALLDYEPTVVEADADEVTFAQYEDAIESARDAITDEIRPELEDLREKATEAANEELTEYRRLQRQRLEDVEDRLQTIDGRLSDISETLESTSDHGTRLEALDKREELRSERERLQAEREELTAEIDAGFPERRAKIADRHSVRVTVTPVALTRVTYERGEIEFETEHGVRTDPIAFAPGVGPLEELQCGSCGTVLSESNPITLFDRMFVGACCTNDE